MKIKKMKKQKIYYSEKKPHKFTMACECQIWKFFYSKNKKKAKLSWPMSAKFDT